MELDHFQHIEYAKDTVLDLTSLLINIGRNRDILTKSVMTTYLVD